MAEIANIDRVAEQILEGVRLDPKYENLTSSLHYNHRWGFLESAYGTLYHDLGRITLVGFGLSGWQEGTREVEDQFEPITDSRALNPVLNTLERQGKGTGPRLYNTPQALEGTQERPERIGMYAFAVKQSLIWDKRWPVDGNLAGKFVHHAFETGSHRLFAAIVGKDRFIELNNARAEGAEAILRPQSFSATWRKRRLQAPSSAVPEQFMIIRRPDAVLQKVGEYRVDNGR